ncbi:MAG: V-type ATP synthase subunit E [Victivallales bacterium]|nr:V-type ATP synthase subunit E [Victivallales bacterium]
MEDQERRLEEELRADAREKAERVVARATADAATALKRAKTLNERRRAKALAQARAEAERKAENILAGIWNEQRKMWLMRREQAIQNFLNGMLADLAGLEPGSAERRKSLEALATEALAAVSADELIVTVAPADQATVTPDWLAERLPAGRSAHFTIQPDTSIGGGLRVASRDGRLDYDNTFAGRLMRMEEEFRRTLADCDKDNQAN